MATQQYNFNSSPAQKSNTIIILSNGEWVSVPDGADPDSFRKLQEARLRLAANPKAKKQTYRRTDNGNRRNRRARLVFAGHIVGEATARRMDEMALEDETFVSGIEWDEFEKAGE